MKISYRGKSNLVLKHWMYFHPYRTATFADYYYFDICKQVRKLLDLQENKELTEFFQEDEKNHFSCYLTAYFEDVISQTGIWKAFTSQHKTLYNTFVPFYKPSEYYFDEINPEDVNFLTWFYISNINPERVISPNAGFIEEFASQVFEIFEEKYEVAPENKSLKEFLILDKDETDYYVIRSKIEWLVLDSYLFYHNRLTFLDEIQELYQSEEEPHVLQMYEREIQDSYNINRVTPLLALRGKDWLANVLTSRHPLYNDLIALSEKKTGYFLYKKYDDDFLYLEHIATDTSIPVTRKSIDLTEDLIPDETIFMISLVKWQDEWWFSGNYFTISYNADIILDEKNSTEKRGLFNINSDIQIKTIEEHYQCFLELNNNSPIAFFNNGKDLASFLNNMIDFWNKSLKLSKKEHQESIKRVKQKGFLNAREEIKINADQFPEIPGLIFFNRNSGIETLFGYNDLIPAKNNPNYNPEKESSDILEFLTSQHNGGSLVHYVIDTYDGIDVQFPGETDANILMENLDFMLRYWKKGNYHNKPQLSVI